MSKRNRILIFAAAALLVAAAVTAPFLVQSVSELPFFRYLHLENLVKTIEDKQIYWQEGDDPMLYAWQKHYESEEIPSRSVIRRDFIDLIRTDGDNYYLLANSMLSYYDRYSRLVSREEYIRLYPENENYGGLGMIITSYEPFIRVVKVYEESAAGRAGIQAGDLIAYVNGDDIRTLSYDDSSDRLAEVSKDGGSIGIVREGENELLTFPLTPGEVVIPNVEWHVDGDIAYLNITLFAGNDFNDLVDAAFSDFEEQGAAHLILDLRDNRGGTINLLIHLMDALTAEEDVLMFTEIKRDRTIEHYSNGVGMAFDDVVVLANENTCSSAEVCTGYMKDRGYPVLGTLTYGKGTGLSMLDFYGDILVLATIDISLPITGHYNEIGIVPTEEVSNAGVSPELPVLLPLETTAGIDDSSSGERILALEQRLSVLGYLLDKPDGVWDAATDAAVGAVAELAGETDASPETLELLENMTERLAGALYYADTQLEEAYRLFDAANPLAA